MLCLQRTALYTPPFCRSANIYQSILLTYFCFSSCLEGSFYYIRTQVTDSKDLQLNFVIDSSHAY